jgi:hypothetical protein
MKHLLFALLLAGAMGAQALAQTVPIGTPPAPGTPTTNLILNAMLATARAASVNPSAAASASLNSSAAIQRYNMGDENGARSAAIQALIQANQLPSTPVPILQSTIGQASAMHAKPFPVSGASVAAIDADAFVGQARGAVAACQQVHSANAGPAAQQLANAEREDKAGHYQNVRAAASTAVNLCAPAQQQINRGP